MCYQLEQLLEKLKDRLKCLNSETDLWPDEGWNLDPVDERFRGKLGGRIEELEDVIEIVESMLTTSKCKGNHLG